MSDSAQWKPGWYPHPGMHDTLCFYDGIEWTSQVAPMPPAVQEVTWSGKGLLTFVLLVCVVVIVVVFVAIAAGGVQINVNV